MAYQRSNPGYTGYPALFFLETLHDGRGDAKISQRMISLEKRYSYLRAYLPVFYAKNDAKKAEYLTDISPKLETLKDEMDAMSEQYDATFEGDSCNSQEKIFLKTMRGVRERIDEIAALTGIIDKIASDDEEFIV